LFSDSRKGSTGVKRVSASMIATAAKIANGPQFTGDSDR
jgi:hypothetical protein